MIIKNVRLINPADGRDEICRINIEDGLIKEIVGQASQGESTENKQLDEDSNGTQEILDAKGCIAAPGLVDVHVHFRDPGFT